MTFPVLSRVSNWTLHTTHSNIQNKKRRQRFKMLMCIKIALFPIMNQNLQKPMIHWHLRSIGDAHVVFVTLSSRTTLSQKTDRGAITNKERYLITAIKTDTGRLNFFVTKHNKVPPPLAETSSRSFSFLGR